MSERPDAPTEAGLGLPPPRQPPPGPWQLKRKTLFVLAAIVAVSFSLAVLTGGHFAKFFLVLWMAAFCASPSLLYAISWAAGKAAGKKSPRHRLRAGLLAAWLVLPAPLGAVVMSAVYRQGPITWLDVRAIAAICLGIVVFAWLPQIGYLWFLSSLKPIRRR